MEKNKILSLLLVLVLMLTLIRPVNVYADGDVTAPKVTSLQLETNEITYTGPRTEKTLNIGFDFIETETGIKSVSVLFSGNGNNQHLPLHSVYNFETATYSGHQDVSFTIGNRAMMTDYVLSSVTVVDYAGNSRTYTAFIGETDLIDRSTGGGKINVIGLQTLKLKNANPNAPRINNFTIESNSVELTGEIPFSMEVTSATSEVSVRLYLYRQYNYLYSYCNAFTSSGTLQVVDGKVKGTLSTTSDDLADGEHVIGIMEITDGAGNTSIYWNKVVNAYPTDDNGEYIADATDDTIHCSFKGNSKILIKNKDDRPQITKIDVLTKQVTKPGLVDLDIYTAGPKTITAVSVAIITGEGTDSIRINASKFITQGADTSVIRLSIPVSSEKKAATYKVGYAELLYGSEARHYSYCVYNDKMEFVSIADNIEGKNPIEFPSGNTVEIKEEYNVAFEAGIDNPELITKVKALKEGETGRVLITSSSLAKADLFSEIMGKNVNIIFQKENYQWKFNGKDIVAENIKDIDVNVAFSKYSLANSSESFLKVDFADNGKLPGKSSVRIKSDYTKAIYDLSGNVYLYYMNNDSNSLDYEENSNSLYFLDGADSWCQFDISHNSSFVLSGKQLSEAEKNLSTKVEKIKIVSASKKLVAGKKLQLSVDVLPSDATEPKVIWTSSNKKYATVDEKGLVKTKKAGAGKSVVITATATDGSKVSDSIKIALVKDSVKKISIISKKKTLKVGKAISLKAKVETTGKTAYKGIEWKSSNEKYATVNSKGKVKALKAGKGKTVKITALAKDGSGKKAVIKLKIK